MAKNSNLREFQEAILLRLKEAATQGDVASGSRLGVTVGDKKILVNLNEVREVLPVPPVQHVPLTQQWFMGVANIRGNLYNITDLAQFLGMAPTQKSPNNRILLLSSETTSQVALLVGSLIGLRNINLMQLKPFANDGDIFFSKGAYEDTENNEWFEVDIEILIKDKEFIQPTLS